MIAWVIWRIVYGIQPSLSRTAILDIIATASRPIVQGEHLVHHGAHWFVLASEPFVFGFYCLVFLFEGEELGVQFIDFGLLLLHKELQSLNLFFWVRGCEQGIQWPRLVFHLFCLIDQSVSQRWILFIRRAIVLSRFVDLGLWFHVFVFEGEGCGNQREFKRTMVAVTRALLVVFSHVLNTWRIRVNTYLFESIVQRTNIVADLSGGMLLLFWSGAGGEIASIFAGRAERHAVLGVGA